MGFAEILMYVALFTSLFFEVFLLITFIENISTPKPRALKRSSKRAPTVAIIVPCWNEEHTVAGTLNSLLTLSYPKDKLHIYVVNDGSTDDTARVLTHYETHPQITVIHKANGGKHSAMNEALKHITEDIVGCLDADSFVDSEALRYIVAHFSNSDVAAVTPNIQIFQPKTLLQFIQKAEYGISVFVRNTFARENALLITPGPFSFFRRNVIEEVGGWRHAHGTEDLEICLRLQMHKKLITNEPRAVVYTTAPRTLKTLYKQRVRWTFGFLKNARDYSHMFFNKEHNTLGILILPLSYFSIFSGIFLFFLFVLQTTLHLGEWLVRVSTVGITHPHMSFDAYYTPTSVAIAVVLALIVLTLVIMGIGKHLSKEKPVSLDMIAYITLYGFIAPLWLTASVYKAVTQKSVRWR